MTNEFESRIAQSLAKIFQSIGWTGVEFVRLGDGTIPGKVVVVDSAKERPGNMWAYDPHDKTRGPFQVSNQFAGLAYDDSQAHLPIWIGYPPKSKVLSIGGLDPNIGHVFTGGALPSQAGIVNAAMTTPDRFLSMRLTVTSTPLMLAISGGWWRKQNRLVWTPPNQTFLDLTDYLPDDDADAKYLLVGIDQNNALVVVEGETFLSTLTETAAFIPTTMTEGALIVALVVVFGSDTTIAQSRIIPIPDIYSVWASDTISISDEEFSIYDDADPTKIVEFEVGNGATATTRTITLPLRSTGLVILSPGASTDNVIQPTGDFIPLILKGNASQTVSLLEVQNSTPTTLLTVTAAGRVGIGSGTTSPGEILSIGYGANSEIAIGSATNNKGYLGVFNNNLALAVNRRISDGSFANTSLPTASISFVTLSADSRILFNTASANNTIDTERMRIDKDGHVGIGTVGNVISAQLHVLRNSADTNSAANVLILGHNTSGTPASGFGSTILIRGESSTTADQDMFAISTTWATATHASRKAQVVLSVYDTAARTAVTLSTNGSAAAVSLAPTTIDTTLSVQHASAAPTITISGAAGTNRALVFATVGVGNRWLMRGADSATESGSNAGSDFRLIAIDDAGSGVIGTPLVITRSTLAISMANIVTVSNTTTATNTVANTIIGRHLTSGTPTTGFGALFQLQGHSSTNTVRQMGDMFADWITATDASRAARLVFRVWDTAAREGIILTATGSVATVALAATTVNPNLTVTQPTLGSEVFRVQSTATNDDPVEIVYQNRAATTDATVTTLHTFTVPASTTYMIEARVTARRTGGTGGTAEDAAGYVIRGTYKNVAGTATLVGAVNADYTAEDQAAWDATLTVSGATVLLRVTGAANNNITWHATARVSQVSS